MCFSLHIFVEKNKILFVCRICQTKTSKLLKGVEFVSNTHVQRVDKNTNKIKINQLTYLEIYIYEICNKKEKNLIKKKNKMSMSKTKIKCKKCTSIPSFWLKRDE